ncbi:MAG: electron transport complex subunit RsxC, partial [Gammaproteobacteria bacterium]|nr:electron transport complex subunit RsxC [Gammaproteobacteria bacterium]
DERKKSNIARERHEARQQRLERQKQEREDKLRAKREMLNVKKGEPAESEIDKKKAAIAEALARVKKKKETQEITPKNTENLSAEQQRLIDEVDQRRKAQKQKHDD